jgi:tetratricopeptide (TPR) repeat protein
MVHFSLRLLVTACVLIPALTGWSESASSTDQPAEHVSRDTVQPIPLPDMSRLETASRAQIEEMQERVKALSETSPDGTLLAKGYGELGKLYNAHRLNDAAYVCYRNAELLAPEDYRWTYYRAHLFRGDGEVTIAIRGLTRALELMKRDVSVRPQQFVAALAWLGTLYQSNGAYDTARLMYEQAIKINPGVVQPQVGLAQIAAAEGNHEEAIERLEAVKSKARSGSQAENSIRYQLGMSYRAMGDMERARANLEGARSRGSFIVLDPLLEAMTNSVISSVRVVRRGNEAANSGRIGEAIELYRKALAIDPANHIAHLRLARVLEHSGQHQESLSHFERATELKPESASVWNALFRALRRRGQTDQALAALEISRRLEKPTNVETELDYAQMLLEDLDRPGDALISIEQVLEREPANERALAGRAAALSHVAGCGASLASLEDAHTRVPTSHHLADGLARALLLCGGKDEAPRALTLSDGAFAASARPRYAVTGAMLRAAAEDFEGAVHWQEKAIALAKETGFDARAEQYEVVLRDFYQQGRPWRPAPPALDEEVPPATDDGRTAPDTAGSGESELE